MQSAVHAIISTNEMNGFTAQVFPSINEYNAICGDDEDDDDDRDEEDRHFQQPSWWWW